MAEVKSHKVKQLGSKLDPNAIYWVQASANLPIEGFITDIQGVPYPLKDISGSGEITNTDGNLVIIGASNKVINIAPALLSIINSALQSGDNISELINDAGYITSADLPTKTSELINDGENGNPFVDTGDLGATAFSNDYNDLDNLPTIPSAISFADQTETNEGIVEDKTIAPNTLAVWWDYVKTLAQTFTEKITFNLGALFTPQATPTHERGRVYFDDVNDCLAYMDSISGTSVQVGQEMIMRARNNTGATILNGSVVYVSGAIGQNSTIALAQANAMPTSEIIGIATHDIPNNTIGKVCVFGQVNDLDTSSFSDGNALFLSSSVAGGLVVTPPTSPNFVVAVGVVEHAHPTQGKILVKPQRALANNNSLGTSQSISATQNAVKTYVDNALVQVYKTISANTALDDTFHNAIIWVTATCNITIGAGLRTDFTTNVRTFTGATATYLTSGTVINTESDGDVQAPKTMANISTYSTNNFIISGGGLS